MHQHIIYLYYLVYCAYVCVSDTVGPVDEKTSTLPDILSVMQVALEGEISKQSVMASLSRGERASGDLIPWLVAQQFQDNNFASLSGGRIVRIATHPSLQRVC